MQDTITRYLAGVNDSTERTALKAILAPIADRMSSCPTSSAGLVIKAGGSALAKTGSGVYQGLAQGKSVKIAAATDMPALTGLVITANKFNVACFFIDSAEVVTMLYGTEGATENAVVFPQFPVGKALVGYLVITHSSTFTGGTTPLDTATTKYVSPVGPFDPSILI